MSVSRISLIRVVSSREQRVERQVRQRGVGHALDLSHHVGDGLRLHARRVLAKALGTLALGRPPLGHVLGLHHHVTGCPPGPCTADTLKQIQTDRRVGPHAAGLVPVGRAVAAQKRLEQSPGPRHGPRSAESPCIVEASRSCAL